MEGTVVKAMIGEWEEEARADNSRRMRKDLTGVVQGVLGRRSFLVRFQNGREKNLSSNQLTVVIVDTILVEEELWFLRLLRYWRIKSKKRRDTIAVSMLCYSLKKSLLLTVRSIRRTWRVILMKRRWTM